MRPRNLCLLGLIAGVLAAPAAATFPGANGSIVYSIARVLPDNYVDFDICDTTADGGTARRVTTSLDHQDLSPAPSADGTRLAFSREPATSEGGVHLFVSRADGTSPKDLRTSGFEPAWSPDGRRLVFSAGDLYLLDLTTARRTILFNPTGAGARASGAEWSPDGALIAFTYTRADQPAAVYTIGLDGRNLARLTEGGGPTWSPDGSMIGFSNRHGDIYTARRDGTDIRVVTAGPALDFAPSWSPDGTKIAFVRVSEKRNRYSRAGGAETDIYVVSAAGGVPRNATRTPFNESEPSWAPRQSSSHSATTPCTVRGTSRADLLTGSSRPDVVYAGAGADVLRGGRGADLLDGEGGPDRLAGGPGDDSLAGGASADRLAGNAGSDRIFGGAGSDRIDARDRRRDVVDCGRGQDQVTADYRDRIRRNCERRVLG
jgi:dipeptidyl aminopeptidase/acylaminoacyl peptidase